MPRYDERSGPTRLYVGHISRRTRSRDLEDIFSKYGRVRDVDMKHDFAFVDFGDSRDADDARHYLNGRTFDGSRIVVEFAKRGPRGDGGSRDYVGRGPAPGTGRCYNCGHDGHWARDCKAGDWKNKCYKCGQQGHIERNCNNSPRAKRSVSRSRSRSRSPLKGRRRRSRSRSYSPRRSRYSRSPRKEALNSPSPDQKRRSESRSRSRSPKRTRSRNPSRSPPRRNYSHSPTQSPRQRTRSHSPPVNSPKRGHSQSPAPNDENPARSRSISPVGREDRRDLSPSSPRNAWRSPNNNSERDDDAGRGAASRSASSSPQRDNGLHQDYVSPQNGNSPSRSG